MLIIPLNGEDGVKCLRICWQMSDGNIYILSWIYIWRERHTDRYIDRQTCSSAFFLFLSGNRQFGEKDLQQVNYPFLEALGCFCDKDIFLSQSYHGTFY